jgi:uncharacterized protein DUF6491
MTSTFRLCGLAIAVAALPYAAPSARAQDEQSLERAPVACINVSRLQRAQIVDDQTILFYLPGDRVYRNTLQQRCQQLDRTDAIGYGITSSRLARLCEIDLITTEDGVTCQLGPFEPITRDEAKAIAAAARSDDVDDVASGDATPAPSNAVPPAASSQSPERRE